MSKPKAGLIPYFPVSLNILGRKCVVIGGGEVALRKVKILLEHGADIEVISPEFCTELAELIEDRKINVCNHAYKTGDLVGAFLAVAATDNDEINQQIAEDARRKAILVNVVDNAEKSDFIVSSYFSRDGLTIAVSTSGQSPALARKIRIRLEQEITNQYGTLTQLIGEVRSEIKRDGIKIKPDRWQEALNLDVLLELLTKGERGKAKDFLISELKEKQNLYMRQSN